LQVELEPATVSIGQQAVWKIKVVENKNSCRVIVSNPSFSNLELTGAYNKEDVEGDDKKVREYPDDITYAASLISFDEGEYKIAPQKITVVDKDGNISEILTGEKTLKVKSLIANEPEPKIKEDKGKGEVVIEKDNTFIYIFVGLISVILIVLLTLLGRKLWQMRKPAPAAPPPPPRPAEVIAFEKLNGLKNSQYLNEDKHKEFHLKLSESIREYLGNRYHFDSLEKSTFELIGLIKNNKIKREIFLEIVKLLEDTDLVKFAKYIPDVGESRELLEDAFRIVNITTEEAMALKNRTSLENSDDSKPQSVPGGDV
jgi:hypothetical protein